ncbi:unnamed protein product [Ceutorhynchus assimilis]|uniref:CKK domain-containing protein n=1 Tax=Ceutorhynchus assimilis TaxID=467358 RepID=A0A9N9MW18_9CUCU|nr:unnamed protein product [Ceutorhynchus assimilis]
MGKTIDRQDLLSLKPTPKMRPKASTRPRPKTIHIDSGSVQLAEGMSSRGRKGSTSNLTAYTPSSMKRDYYRGSQDSLADRSMSNNMLYKELVSTIWWVIYKIEMDYKLRADNLRDPELLWELKLRGIPVDDTSTMEKMKAALRPLIRLERRNQSLSYPDYTFVFDAKYIQDCVTEITTLMNYFTGSKAKIKFERLQSRLVHFLRRVDLMPNDQLTSEQVRLKANLLMEILNALDTLEKRTKQDPNLSSMLNQTRLKSPDDSHGMSPCHSANQTLGRRSSYKTSRGSSTDQDSLAYRFGDTDSGLGRATPPRRAPSPGMGLRHLPSPSGPGSLPGLMSKGRRVFDDGSSDISSTPSSMMDYNGPRLYKQPATKSNRSIMLNAVEYCVFPGVVNREAKKRVLEEINRSESKHFLILFRDAGCQFRALYSYCPDTEEIQFGRKMLFGSPHQTPDRNDRRLHNSQFVVAREKSEFAK